MSRKNFVFTSESVSEGHPDKVCDRISDEIVDLFFREALARASTLGRARRLRNPGHHQSRGDRRRNPRASLRHQGKDRSGGAPGDQGHRLRAGRLPLGDGQVVILLHGQSADIAAGVDAGEKKDEGAGDQGIMFGYACDETPGPDAGPLYYSHNILQLLAEARHSGRKRRSGPTPRARSASSTRTASPSAPPRSSSRTSTSDESRRPRTC